MVFNLLIPVVPCFYFISGFLASDSLATLTKQSFKERLIKLFRCYVVPAAVFLCIAFPYKGTLYSLMHLSFSANYFLWTLFMANVMAGGVLVIMARFSELAKMLSMAALIAVGGMVCLLVNAEDVPFMDFKTSFWAVMFFAGGYIAGRRPVRLLAVLRNKPVVIATVFIWLGFSIARYYFEAYPVLHSALFRFVIPITGIFAYLAIFICFGPIIEKSPRVTALSIYTGRRSLASYVISWCFISLLTTYPIALQIGDAGYIALILTIYVASIAVYDTICRWPRLSTAFFGR